MGVSKSAVLLLLIILVIVTVTSARTFPRRFQENKDDFDFGSMDSAEKFKAVSFLGSESEESAETRQKRFISFFEPNKEFHECEAPGNKSGHCRHMHYCLMDEIRNNYFAFVRYFCIITPGIVGICCPDAQQNKTETHMAMIAEDSIEDDFPSKQPSNKIDEPLSRINNGPDNNPDRGCGVSSKSNTRIVGGRPAGTKEWPWMAALLRDKVQHFCGGVLITDRHILTAAHCISSFKPLEIRVRLGEYDFTRTDDANSRDFRVVDIRQHPGFNGYSYIDDIAILKLHTATTFTDDIWPICLPPVNDEFSNRTATVTGWGTQGYAAAVSDVLMEVSIPIWPQERCESAFKLNIPNATMCAGGWYGGQDSCQGDSGGPLMHRLSSGRWIAVGVVSWGIRCGERGRPGLYTRVNKYLPWIVDNCIF